MQKNAILIVEDNTAIRQFVAHNISAGLSMDTLEAACMQDAMDIIEKRKDNIFLTVLDLNLPDAPNGEIVDAVIAEKLPVIVLTGSMKESMHEMMAAKPIIDYVIKKNLSEMSYLVTLIDRLKKNINTKVLIVDDEDTTRNYLRILLSMQNFQIYDAASGKQGLAILKEHPDIKLVISDYMMPEMDGEEFIFHIREKFSREQLAIIAISSQNDSKLAAKLLKSGANDFIARPFLNEEFFCRVGNNIDSIRNFEHIRSAAICDHLTGMYNRKYLFEAGVKLYNNAKRNNLTIATAMLDIDHFKKINDTWGHHTGDLALKHVSAILGEQLRSSDLLARMGGEEFCVIATNIDSATAEALLNRIRKEIEDHPLKTEDAEIKMTISIGFSTVLHKSLEDMINSSDHALYNAKESGRNKVMQFTN